MPLPKVSFSFFSFINLGLRFSSLLSKFILVIFITQYLSIEELGVFGLFNTTLTIGVFFIGIDFYNFNTREIINSDDINKVRLIKDQFIFHAISYIVLLPLIYFPFHIEILPAKYISIFFGILILEHLSQEIYRLLVIFNQPIFANFVLFVRSGLWIFVVIVLWRENVFSEFHLFQVFNFWFFGVLISVIIGSHRIWMSLPNKELLYSPVSWSWIFKGIKMSIPFFIGSIAYKIMEYSDRYFIDVFLSKAHVGVFTFYSGISKMVQVGIFTVVTMIYYPRLVETYKVRMEEYIEYKRKFYKETFYYSLGFGLAAIALIDPLLEFIDKQELAQHKFIFLIMVLSQVILCFSYIPHYSLYVKKKDNLLMYTTIVGAILNILSNFILIQIIGLLGAVLSTFISFCVILLLKLFYSFRGN